MLNEPLTFVFFAVIAISLAFYFKLLIDLKTSSEVKLPTFLDSYKRHKPTNEKKQLTEQKSNLPENLEAEPAVTRKWECPHYVGYLTTLPKGSSFPEDCFGCRKVIQCMNVQPTKVIESFYLGTSKTSEIET